MSPLGKIWAQDRSSRGSWSGFLRENSKWWMKIHTRLTWVSRVKKVIQQFYWLISCFGFIWGQSCLATLVTPQNCTKNAKKSYFCCTICIFSLQTKNSFCFFEQLSLQKATFNSFLNNFLRNYRKLFGISRATCGKP